MAENEAVAYKKTKPVAYLAANIAKIIQITKLKNLNNGRKTYQPRNTTALAG